MNRDEVHLTQRGFQYLKFNDRYDLPCELQQSSLADYEKPGTSAVWLGYPENRMHLDRNHAWWLVRKLVRWLLFGNFGKVEDERRE